MKSLFFVAGLRWGGHLLPPQTRNEGLEKARPSSRVWGEVSWQRPAGQSQPEAVTGQLDATSWRPLG
eukprot:NODE_4020_length_850_cov_2.709114_g3332_i0.p2 GENE.NODE_4020_length_850_cov_2.709114_g3332_i0~~NODE_4020_length_850_cov_2.709114_g3332_i0.p2  ORF type:complete len:67 (-),score=4.13 NODE_4020_length_850_cov_2.709114_g3332_i0:267-467(-)